MAEIDWDMVAVMVALLAILATSVLNLWATREQISTAHQSTYRAQWNQRLRDAVVMLLTDAKTAQTADEERAEDARASVHRALLEIKMMIDPPYPEQKELLRLVDEQLASRDAHQIVEAEDKLIRATLVILQENWKRLQRGK